jgi:CDP-6-deoxy-D-xylo-4-hexulose-3-dehydrase
VQLKHDRPEALRLATSMEGSDEIMNSTLFLGTFPGLTEAMLQAEIDVINKFTTAKSNVGF